MKAFSLNMRTLKKFGQYRRNKLLQFTNTQLFFWKELLIIRGSGSIYLKITTNKV
jgi:hypothetical protein